MSERVAKQFNKIRKNGPSAEWLDSTRNFLVKQVSQDTLDMRSSWTFNFKMNSSLWLKKLTPAPAKILSFILLIGVVSGTSMVARAEYIPTRPLYTVKRTFEKIDFLFAVTPESETKVLLKHAAERQEEAVKLVNQPNINEADKADHINTVLKSMEQDITAAKNSLEISKDTEKTDKKVTKIAKDITENTKGTIEALDKVKEILPNKDINKTVTSAQSVLEDVENVSLEVLIKGVSDDELAASTEEDKDKVIVSKDELKQIITDKIERSSDKIKKVEAAAVTLNAAEVPEKEDKNNVDDVITESVEKTTQAQEILTEAKNLLDEEQPLDDVLNKIKESNEITKETEKSLDKVEEKIQQQSTETSTSTEPILPEPPIEEISTTSSTGSVSIDLDYDNLPANFAPLGGPIKQTATQTPEENTDEIPLLNILENEAKLDDNPVLGE